MKTKLNFKWIKTELNGGSHYLAENYSVTNYGDKWQAYHAVGKTKDGKYIFGDSCFHTPRNESMSYKTANEAMKACQEHLESDNKKWSYVA
jgi:hypothetical protein